MDAVAAETSDRFVRIQVSAELLAQFFVNGEHSAYRTTGGLPEGSRLQAAGPTGHAPHIWDMYFAHETFNRVEYFGTCAVLQPLMIRDRRSRFIDWLDRLLRRWG